MKVFRKHRGRLAIVGGRLEPDNAAVFEAMGRMCEGRIAVIPVASEIPETVGAEAVDGFRRNGIEAEIAPIVWGDPNAACDNAVVDLLISCGSVFFTGGDQSKIVKTLVNDRQETPALRAIRGLYANGGLVAGSSAGAAVMSEQMILGGTSNEALTLGKVDDPDIPGLALGSGLGFFSWGVVDQHFNARGRIGRLAVAVRAAGERYGFGVDENTALLVDGGMAQVLGQNGVVVIDLNKARLGEDNSIEDIRISHLDDGDGYDLRRNKVVPHSDKKRIRISRSSFQKPAPIKRCAFGIFTVHDLMLRLAEADPSHYNRDSVSSWPESGEVEWCVEIERVPRESRALYAIRAGTTHYTVINFRLHIHRGDRPLVEVPRIPIHAHHRENAPPARLVLLGNSPLAWRSRHIEKLRSFLKEPVGVMATASARPRQVALEYVDWLRGLDITAEEIAVDEHNIEQRNRDRGFLRLFDRMGSVLITGGNQRRLTQTLTHRGEVTSVLRRLIGAFDNGSNLIAVGGAAAAFGQPMIAEGDSFEALRFGASEDAGSEGMVMESGLGLFDAGIVDQNFLSRSRLGRLLVACAEEHVRFGFGICEESGLVVKENELEAFGRRGFVVVAVNRAGLSIVDHAFSARGIELQLVEPGGVFDVEEGIVPEREAGPATAAIESMVSQLASDCNGMFRSRDGSIKEGWLNVAFSQGPPSTLDIESHRVRY